MENYILTRKTRKGVLTLKFTDIFQNIWEDVSMKVSTWGKILIFLM